MAAAQAIEGRTREEKRLWISRVDTLRCLELRERCLVLPAGHQRNPFVEGRSRLACEGEEHDYVLHLVWPVSQGHRLANSPVIILDGHSVLPRFPIPVLQGNKKRPRLVGLACGRLPFLVGNG